MDVALTGGAAGIGAAVLARLTARGDRVTVFDSTEPAGGVAWIPVDMADPASVDAALARATGPYDALVNNAGLPPRPGNAAQVLAVNVLGLRRFWDGIEPRLTPGAAIVTTASRAGAAWRENLAEVQALLALDDTAGLPAFIEAHGVGHVRAYHLSKEAVIAMTTARTAGLTARGLRANTVSPSAVDTSILPDFTAAFPDRAERAMTLAGRAASADEIAALIVFLADPDSGWIRGQDITIDGGVSAVVLAGDLGLA